jgi:membrane protein YqaA with SNARE-associated domain
MDTATLIQDLGIYVASFVVCLISGLVPLVNAELFLIGVVTLAPDSHEFFMLVLMGTLGQMVAKMAMYWAARGALNMSLARYEKAIAKWRHRFTRSEPGLSFFIFVSAFTGIPPFFVTSILAGTFRVPFVRFWLVGFLGRFVRFALVVLFPKALMELF